MKAKIKSSIEKKEFKPFTLELEIESKQEAATLYRTFLFNEEIEHLPDLIKTEVKRQGLEL